MEQKNIISEKIIEDAIAREKEIISLAEKKGQDLVSAALKERDEVLNEIILKSKSEAQEIINRKLVVANLEAKKAILKAKQEAIDNVFKKVYSLLLSLSKSVQLQFLVKHIAKIAEEGDVIVLSENNVVCAKDLENIDVIKRLKLSVSSEKGGFNGGIYLKGKVSDKDLSFSAIISEAKEKYVKEIAENLFGII